jgi:transposase
MDCDALRDDQWERIKGFVPGGTRGKRGPRTNNRRFLDALLWMARSGGRWRDLPERLGDYRSVKRRYYRWIEMGVLDDKIVEMKATVVIPPKRNRKDQRSYDAELYKERNIIERFFNKLKQFRRVATRYDKLLANFMGFVKLAAIAIWLKWLNRRYGLGCAWRDKQ